MSASAPGLFTRLGRWAAEQSGKPPAFIAALAVVLAWLAAGPTFGFADTLYQLSSIRSRQSSPS